MGIVKEQSLIGMKWNALGQFSTKGINFVLGLIVARLLMPEDYGVIAMLDQGGSGDGSLITFDLFGACS